MPIGARQQAVTTDEKFSQVMQIIGNIKSPHERSIINNFILELSQRYITKDKELHGYISPSIKAMNTFETEYMERIIKEFGSIEK